jgi:hypothetical protein
MARNEEQNLSRLVVDPFRFFFSKSVQMKSKRMPVLKV